MKKNKREMLAILESYAEDHESLKRWITGKQCSCEFSFESYEKCCGKDKDTLENLFEFFKCPRKREKPFVELSIEQQNSIMKAVFELDLECHDMGIFEKPVFN